MSADTAASAGHTPGPFHVGGKDDTIVFDRDGWAIADTKTYHGRHRSGEAQRNAHLLAASPDLLETLQSAPQPYEYMSKADFNDLPFHMRSFVDAHKTWLDKASAAISIAQGGSGA